MARCETCGNEYDKAFEITLAGRSHTFDSFECAIQFAGRSWPSLIMLFRDRAEAGRFLALTRGSCRPPRYRRPMRRFRNFSGTLRN
jgi:hypothetical protein